MPACQKRALNPIADGCEPHCGCWELSSSGPVEGCQQDLHQSNSQADEGPETADKSGAGAPGGAWCNGGHGGTAAQTHSLLFQNPLRFSKAPPSACP